MADLVGPLRPADSWSATEVRSLTHNHVWTIKGFSQCDCRYLETSTKVPDLSNSAAACSSSNANTEPPTITFRIRLHPQGNKESNKDFTFFQCFSSSNQSQSNPQFKSKYKFTIFNSRGEEIATTVYTGTQQLHGYFEYIRRDLLVGHVLPQDELQLNLELIVTFDTITKNSQTVKSTGPPQPKPAEVTQDFEALFYDSKLADFTICVGDNREILTHKVVLSARSPVFAAMLEPHTEESQNSRVTIEDIEYDVMNEMLLYLYSGKSPNVATMGLELLAVSDRFQLPGLKAMADYVLRTSLTVENACRNLVYADMYNSTDLKNEALRYITANILDIVQTDGWNELSRQHPALTTEVVVCMAEKKQGVASSRSFSQMPTTSSSSGEPPSKRIRSATFPVE